jgi:hypothetical protein
MIVELAMVAIALKLALEDAGHGARYQESPRLASRRRDRGQRQRGPVRKAARRYAGDLADDARQSARTWQAKRGARKAARRSGDGRFTDFDPRTQRWTPSCDACGWTGRSYRIEGHADAERHAHTCQRSATPTPAAPQPQTLAGPAAAPRRPESAPEEPEVAAATPPTQQGAATMSDIEAIQQTRDAITTGIQWAENLVSAINSYVDSVTTTSETTLAASSAFHQAAERDAGTEITQECAPHVVDVAEAVNSASTACCDASSALQRASADISAAIDSFFAASAAFEAAVGEFSTGAAEGSEAVAVGATAGV